MDGEAVTVEVTLTDEDVIAFNLWRTAIRRDTGIRRYLGFLGVVFIFAVVAAGYLLDLIGFRVDITFGFMAFFLILFFAVIPARRLVQRWYLRKLLSQGRNAVLYAPTKVTITADAIHSANEYAETTLRWPAIERVKKTEGYVYVFPGSATALILPRRAFAGDIQFDEAYRKATEWMEAAAPESA